MDATTAALALLIAHVCIALVMTGVHVAARRERSTRLWAVSSVLIAAGVLVLVLTGPGQWLPQWLGNACLVFGAVAQYRGLQLFYRRQGGQRAWWIAVGFCVLFGIALLRGAPVSWRIGLLSATLLAVMTLGWRVLVAGIDRRLSFGSGLALGGFSLLMLNNLARIASAAHRGPEVPPMVETDLGVVLLFLVPLGGTILYATGLLLLYFERLVAEKHELATHDELTGLLNRRAIVAAGEREVALAIRARQPLTVAYVDVDFFKDINDALGHEAGDRVLADLSNLLRDSCRSVDLVGRLGGEEFALVLPGMGPEQVACVGERLLAAVRGYRFLDRHPVTVSLGFAALSDPVPAQAWADLLARADAALYRAKQQGRDRYCIDRGDAAAEAAPEPA